MVFSKDVLRFLEKIDSTHGALREGDKTLRLASADGRKERGGRIAEMGAAIVLSIPVYVLGTEADPLSSQRFLGFSKAVFSLRFPPPAGSQRGEVVRPAQVLALWGQCSKKKSGENKRRGVGTKFPPGFCLKVTVLV